MKNVILSIILSFSYILVYSQIDTSEIRKIIQDKQATVGVAVLYKDKAYTISNDNKYPLMSVFKFHIAVTALKKMENENIPLDSMVFIKKEQIHANTYSPLYKRYPNQGIHISLRELIEYMVAHSDNNACNWLIEFVGGIEKVSNYIQFLGIKDFNLSETEYTMQNDIYKSYNNWSTPMAMVELLKKIYEGKILSEECFSFLEKALLNSSSGSNKIKAGLPKGVRIGHKTGSSFRTPTGLQISESDAAVVYMPNGEKCYMVENSGGKSHLSGVECATQKWW